MIFIFVHANCEAKYAIKTLKAKYAISLNCIKWDIFCSHLENCKVSGAVLAKHEIDFKSVRKGLHSFISQVLCPLFFIQ